MPGSAQSARMAGTTSSARNRSNWFCNHIECLGSSPIIHDRPEIESTEYTLIRPASSSPATEAMAWKRSASSASPPAVGNSSTGVP